MLDHLSATDRLRLMRFVCSFAWADFEISPEERAFVARLIRGLELGRDEEIQVHRWLDEPPDIDDLDPTTIPPAHKRFFLEAIEGLIAADGRIVEEESENLELFRALLG